MLYKQSGSKYYWTKFQWRGETYRKSTGATNRKTARAIEAKIRAELAQENYGILQPKEVPTVGEFLKKQFLPYIKNNSAIRRATKDYYFYGCNHLLACKELLPMKLDEIGSQHLAGFMGRNGHLAVSTLNRNLRTLRRALALAEEWKMIDRAPKVTLAQGEQQRDRVVTDEEMRRYLTVCMQPWRDIASMMFALGMRPSEIYALKWEQVDFEKGFLVVLRGKTDNARRLLPLAPIRSLLEHRHTHQNYPREGWVFPANRKTGHITQGSAKNQHLKAITRSGVKPFAPYCLRHTALTNLASECDTFALKSIAGHSSIRVTQRYVHPLTNTVVQAFEKLADRQKVVIAGGHSKSCTEETKVS